MHRGPLVVAVLLALLAVLVPAASGQPSADVHLYQDLAFTDVTDVQDAAPWGEDGYVAATGGGLVLWPGDGPRHVVTTIDGLPTNVVWKVAWTDEGRLLAGTEKGVYLVDPVDQSVEPVQAPDHAKPAVQGLVEEMILTDEGALWVLDRGGNVTERTPGGEWRTHPVVPKHRANDLFVDGDRVLAVGEEPSFGPEGYQNWSVFELDGEAWTQTHHTEDPPVQVAPFDGMDVVGTREGGVHAFQGGEPVDLDQPRKLSQHTVLDLVPDGDRLWVASTGGLFSYDAGTGSWEKHLRTAVPDPAVNAVVPGDATEPVAMAATSKGLLVPNDGDADWVVHRGINGPSTHQFLSLEAREGNQIWAGSGDGVGLFFPGVGLWNEWDQSELGVNVHSKRVHDIEHHENKTWFATDRGVYQFDRGGDSWRIFIEEQAPGGKNTYYDVERDDPWLWMPHWGSGLLRHEIDTNNTYKYEAYEGLISHGLTCVERWHEFLAVCQNEAFQLFDLSRASGQHPIGLPYDRCNNYACNYTAPMNTTLDALPDGERIWVASAHAGLVTLVRDDEEGIAVEEQWTAEDGLPSKEVRAIAPASEGVWVGTAGGLARVTLDGVQETWTSEDGLGEPVINDVERLGGVLYLATFEGLYRLDLDTRELLPLFQGADSLAQMAGHVSITFPSDGARLTAATNMTGKASVPGRPVEEVQIRIDEGDWEAANGTSEWRYRLPVDELDLGTHEAHVRVIANGSDVANTTMRFEVVERSDDAGDAIGLQHTPPNRVVAGRATFLTVEVDAPEPWRVEMEARAGGERFDPQGREAGDEVTFALEIPEDSYGGELVYRFLVRSGAGERWFPQQGMYNASIEVQHERGLQLHLDEERVTVEAGSTAAATGSIRNLGDAFENVTLEADGLRSSWVSASPDANVPLAPDAEMAAEALISVPEGASRGATTFSITAVTEDGRVSDSQALTVLVTESAASTAGGSDSLTTPGVSAALAGLLASLAAVLARRRRDAP